MSELVPDVSGIAHLTPAQRRDAALTVAGAFPGDCHTVAYLLVALGLAAHRMDGFVGAMPDNDGQPWFTPAPGGRTTFHVPLGHLDDRR